MSQHLPHYRPGVSFGPDGVRFSVVSQHATEMFLCLFDKGGNREIHRHAMSRAPGSIFTVVLKGIKQGQRYGYRADGPWQPEHGHRFDPAKLLVDPHATLIDRPFRFQHDFVRRGADTHKIAPKAIVERYPATPVRKVQSLKPGGLIYKLPVKAFSKLNPDIPEELRGTLAAIAHPASIAHFKKMGAAAVELMPVAAWVDERHLLPHHLTNAWGYNPVTFMALEPRIAPGGMADLRKVADALHGEGIALFLDVVYNHSGESDLEGPVLSMRGLDNAMYYRHHADEPGALVNDAGTGNTMAVERGPVRELVLDSLRHMVVNGGADGFRFDLCVSLGRTAKGFSPYAPLFEAMRHDPVLSACTMIAEPWDVGPDGYQLGNFPPQFLEWNDRYRDDIRRFWRGDPHTLGALATRIAGSSDFFGHGAQETRSVNFLAAHDGLTLADVTAFRRKHNYANGEDNRDGHGENFSWNHGVEGETPAPAIRARRKEDVKAMLALIFLSRGTPMLTAGDEFGRTQHGNNNAYAQDNETTWLDWEKRDLDLEEFTANLSRLRAEHPALQSSTLLTGHAPHDGILPDVSWFRANGEPMTSRDWDDPANHFLGLALTVPGHGGSGMDRIAIVVNRNDGRLAVHLPAAGRGLKWSHILSTRAVTVAGTGFDVAAHSVSVFSSVR